MGKTAKDHLALLGRVMSDRITGFNGVVASVYFSIDGYIHLNLTPRSSPEGQKGDSSSKWFDANRLTITDDDTGFVMEPPIFSYVGPAGDAIDVQACLAVIGHKATDPVTESKGVIAGVCFDLYGCVQGQLLPKVKETGEAVDGNWFHLTRMKIEKKAEVKAPNFMPEKSTHISTGKQGPASKPAFSRPF